MESQGRQGYDRAVRVLRLLLPTLALSTFARIAVAEPPDKPGGVPIEIGTYLGGWFSNYFHDFYEAPSPSVRKLETMSPGEVLEVIVDHEPAVENVPKSMQNEGQKVLTVEKISGADWRMVFKKEIE